MSAHAAKVRALVEAERHATLATLADDGAPFGSLVGYSLTSAGEPFVFVSRLAEHTKNLLRDPRASLLVAAMGHEPLASPRVTLVGRFQPAPAEQSAALVEAFVARHPEAERYATFGDFAPWVLAVDRARYVEGFGVMSFVPGEAYRGAFA